MGSTTYGGVAVSGLGMRITHVVRSPEFKGQSDADLFGSITLSFHSYASRCITFGTEAMDFSTDISCERVWRTLAIVKNKYPLLVLMMAWAGVCLPGSGALAQESVAVAEPWGEIIGELRFEGLNRTKQYIVARELVSKIGEPCLQKNLDHSQNKHLSIQQQNRLGSILH